MLSAGTHGRHQLGVRFATGRGFGHPGKKYEMIGFAAIGGQKLNFIVLDDVGHDRQSIPPNLLSEDKVDVSWVYDNA